MNSILYKILCGCFVAIAGAFSSAKAADIDTTILLANNTVSLNSAPATITVIKDANVEYPFILKDAQEESLKYVEEFSNKKRDYLIHSYQKGKSFFAKASAILQKYGLPQELKVLLALESGFDPNAVSTAGAVGYWQIMDEVARDYGLRIPGGKQISNKKNKPQDDRKNFIKSTIAVAKYFNERSKNLGNNILLMVAAYNWGVGNIMRVMKKIKKNNPDFWDIKKYLPAETRNYVMNFIALSVVYNNYDKFVNRQLIFTPQSTQITLMPDLKPNVSAD